MSTYPKKLCCKSGLLIILLSLIPFFGSCVSPPSPENIQPVSVYNFEIVNVYPHDPNAFTQGLVLENGILYESTGLFGRSSVRQVDLKTGTVQRILELPNQYFGEGITLHQDNLIQLTWKSKTGFVYDKDTFGLVRRFTYPAEGWGLTHDNSRLIMSDGTSNLYFLDLETLEITGSVEVRENDAPVIDINELEYIRGQVFANIWKTDYILIINPLDGRVTGSIDLSGLLETQNYTGRADVLNGIAFDAHSGHLFVTGKLWPYLFEIQLLHHLKNNTEITSQD